MNDGFQEGRLFGMADPNREAVYLFSMCVSMLAAEFAASSGDAVQVTA